MTTDIEGHDVERAHANDHELVRAFASVGYALNATLREMLNEHFSHRTERRGCGFTQATRHLAVLVNQPQAKRDDKIAKLFPQRARHARSTAAMDEALRAVPQRIEREESHLLAALIADLVGVLSPAHSSVALNPYEGEIKVGTCPLAEKYFLEVADHFVRRIGRVNVLVSDSGAPLLVEKVKLGDNHSCVSVTELVLNGVRLPAGSLLGVSYDEHAGLGIRANKTLPGQVIPVSRCHGFRFLRLTTLAITPANRERAFSAHFQSQLDAGLFAPGTATVEQLRKVAEAQL